MRDGREAAWLLSKQKLQVPGLEEDVPGYSLHSDNEESTVTCSANLASAISVERR